MHHLFFWEGTAKGGHTSERATYSADGIDAGASFILMFECSILPVETYLCRDGRIEMALTKEAL